MQYTYTQSRYSGPSTIFSPGDMVPDLAAALQALTGARWTFTREAHESPSADGPYYRCGVTRADGLTVFIRQAQWNQPHRGEASIWWERSGCGPYGRKADHRATFDIGRPIKDIARQIVRAVIDPNAEDVTRLRQEHAQRTAHLDYVKHQLASLETMPGVRVNRISQAEAYIGIGPISFYMSEGGHLRITSATGLSLSDLPALAEHFESMKRQLAAE